MINLRVDYLRLSIRECRTTELTQLEQLGGTFYDFTISDASQIKGLDCARA